MRCPDCKSNTLQIILSLELPPDSYNDEITLQTVQCTQCGLQALAVYQESRHGALESESWRHEGYRVSVHDFNAISAAIRRCPRPQDPACQCASHQKLGNQSGYSWNGLEKNGVEFQGVFDIQ